jgi:hypothetical protein
MIRDKFGDSIIAWVLKGSPDGWVLSQRGNHYELEPLERDDKNGTYRVGDEDDGEWIEDDLGRMHHFNGIPLGLHLDEYRQVTDVQDAAVTTGTETRKVTDGGELDLSGGLSLEEIQDHLLVGETHIRGGGRALIVNPYLPVDDTPDVVDLRDTMRAFRHAADPQNPVKAAENAKEAERAAQGMDWGNAAQVGGMIMAFLMGAITVEYIAGGSGGGGVSVPMLVSMLSVMVP